MDTMIAILLLILFTMVICPIAMVLVISFGRRKENKKENNDDSKHSGDK